MNLFIRFRNDWKTKRIFGIHLFKLDFQYRPSIYPTVDSLFFDFDFILLGLGFFITLRVNK